jgi:hypothetical protein
MTESAPSESDLVAMGAHLHVQLRRKTGRVIDVDWLISNAEYASVIIALAKASAITQGAPELEIWATRFERALQRVKRPRKPLLSALAIAGATQLERQIVPAQDPGSSQADSGESGLISEFGDSHRVIDTSEMPSRKPDGERYVWSLR